MNINLFNADVQAFLEANREVNSATIALKKSPFPGISSAELAAQLDARQRAKKKLPLWASTPAIYFPQKINMEQCSSEQTAAFKSSLITENSSLIDLTGGFGIDSFYFAKRAKSVIHCEINQELSAIVAHNYKVLGQENIQCFAGDGTAILQDAAPVDYIYSDPSRRVALKKVFLLSDCEPNIVALQHQLLASAHTIITKVAPLLDISSALRELTQVAEVFVVSLENDCKELLFIQKKDFEGEPQVHAVRLYQGRQQQYSFRYSVESATQNSYGSPSKYLYEPDVAVTKAGAFKSIAAAYGLTKIAQHTHLYSSENLRDDFLGKIFDVQATIPYQLFKKNAHPYQANVISKNFPLKAEELRKKHKIKEGKEEFLFFCSNEQGELIVIYAKRV